MSLSMYIYSFPGRYTEVELLCVQMFRLNRLKKFSKVVVFKLEKYNRTQSLLLGGRKRKKGSHCQVDLSDQQGVENLGEPWLG